MLGFYEHDDTGNVLCKCGRSMVLKFYGFAWICDHCKHWVIAGDTIDFPSMAKLGEWEAFLAEYHNPHCVKEHPWLRTTGFQQCGRCDELKIKFSDKG